MSQPGSWCCPLIQPHILIVWEGSIGGSTGGEGGCYNSQLIFNGIPNMCEASLRIAGSDENRNKHHVEKLGGVYSLGLFIPG